MNTVFFIIYLQKYKILEILRQLVIQIEIFHTNLVVVYNASTIYQIMEGMTE